jgi:hypothetical protein
MKRNIVILCLALTLLLAGCESAQQKAYDLKADTVGTHRVVEVYTVAPRPPDVMPPTCTEGSMSITVFPLRELCTAAIAPPAVAPYMTTS